MRACLCANACVCVHKVRRIETPEGRTSGYPAVRPSFITKWFSMRKPFGMFHAVVNTPNKDMI